MSGVVELSNVKNCPGASNYYHKFRGSIANIRSLDEGEDILLALQRDCERYSELYPKEHDEMIETYKLLKRKCQEAMKEVNEGEQRNECWWYRSV